MIVVFDVERNVIGDSEFDDGIGFFGICGYGNCGLCEELLGYVWSEGG